MTRYSDQIRDEFNRPVPGVAIYVYDLDTSVSPPVVIGLSTLTDDTALPLANPLTSDEFGDFYFNAADGQKRLEFHYGGALRWKEQILVGPLPPGPTGSITISGVEFITPQQFGAVGDNVTNDGAAFLAAIAYLKSIQVTGFGYTNATSKLFIPKGVYYLGTSTLDLTSTMTLEGEGVGYAAGGATVLRWAAGTTGIRVQTNATTGATGAAAGGGSAIGSVIQGLLLYGAYVATEGEYHGIHLRGSATIRDCQIYNFQGDGIYWNAQGGAGAPLEGNANCSYIERVFIQQCRNGIWEQGADGNACTIIAANCINNRAKGIADKSFLGSYHFGCHVAGNGTGAYWADPTNANAASSWISCYSESGEPASVFGPKSYISGGFHAAGMTGGAQLGSSDNLLTVNGIDITDGAVRLLLDDGQASYMRMGSVGGGAPTFTTRSAGSKIVLFDSLSGIANDFGIGVDVGGAALWQTVPNTSYAFKWYGGITVMGTLDSAGFNLPTGAGYKVNGTKVVGAQGAAVADATDAASAITQLNSLLAKLRTHGLIAP